MGKQRPGYTRETLNTISRSSTWIHQAPANGYRQTTFVNKQMSKLLAYKPGLNWASIGEWGITQKM
jgi:hypothetical protein